MPDPARPATLFDSSGERWPGPVAEAIAVARRLEDVWHVAVMPDIHLAQSFCVGMAIATRRLIYPTAVGGDIGCGMLAVAFHAAADDLTPARAERLLAVLPRLVPANRHPDARLARYSARPRHSAPALDHCLQRDGRVQLGTLGRGNHFLELQRDIADGRLWLMVHSGSRAVGQAVSGFHTDRATHRSQGRPYLDSSTQAGQDYLRDVAAARAYARLNRLRIAQSTAFAVRQLLGADIDPRSTIHTDHNHVRQEKLAGQPCWVHRKGAAPAYQDALSVVPGSMGSASYHVRGLGCERALCSCAHGAGRRLDRTTARRQISPEQLRKQMRGIHFRGQSAHRLVDEAPGAYKDVAEVMRKQRRQACVIRELAPLLNYKGV